MDAVVIPGGVLAITLTLIVGTLLALVAAVGIVLRLLALANEQEVRDLTSDRNSYRQIANESLNQLEYARNELRILRGLPPFAPLASVLPEHSSPATPQQQETASIATLRSRLVASVLDINHVQETEHPEGVEPPKSPPEDAR